MTFSDLREQRDFQNNAHRLQPVNCRLWRIVGCIGVVIVLILAVWTQFRIGGGP